MNKNISKKIIKPLLCVVFLLSIIGNVYFIYGLVITEEIKIDKDGAYAMPQSIFLGFYYDLLPMKSLNTTDDVYQNELDEVIEEARNRAIAYSRNNSLYLYDESNYISNSYYTGRLTRFNYVNVDHGDVDLYLKQCIYDNKNIIIWAEEFKFGKSGLVSDNLLSIQAKAFKSLWEIRDNIVDYHIVTEGMNISDLYNEIKSKHPDLDGRIELVKMNEYGYSKPYGYGIE